MKELQNSSAPEGLSAVFHVSVKHKLCLQFMRITILPRINCGLSEKPLARLQTRFLFTERQKSTKRTGKGTSKNTIF